MRGSVSLSGMVNPEPTGWSGSPETNHSTTRSSRWAGTLLWVLTYFLPLLALAQFPRVDGFNPAFGEPGTQVTINGFFSTTTTTRVSFGSGTTPANILSLTSGSITVVVPAGAQTGPIAVTQDFTASSQQDFAVAPRIDSFRRQGSQNVVFAAIGDNVQVEGANFVPNSTTVKVGPTTASSVSVTAPTQLVFTVPDGAETGPISVLTSAGLSTTTSNLIVTGSAVITGFTPQSGVGGTQVTINGGDFTGASAVTFNAVAVQFNVTSASQMIATAPTNAGSGPIVITTPNGDATSSEPFNSVSLAPVITGFAPTSGTAGEPIVITGLNFEGVTNVTFNGTNARFGITSDTQIGAIVPTNVASGPISLANIHGVTTSDNSFGVEPVITGFAPIAGTVGTSVTIHGLNLTEVTNVTFAGFSADFVRTGSDQIQAAVPFGATNGPIAVIAPSGTNSTADDFTVTFGVPLISGFSPTNGLSGTEVVLTGIHFFGATNVTFNGIDALSFGVTSDSQIAAFPPAEATTGPITVFGPAGTNQSTNLFHFPPRLNSFAPAKGPAASPVVILGTNFTGTTSVEFTGAETTRIAAAFTIDHDRQITALVPTNIVDGALTITTPGGRFISSDPFTILPRLDSYSPPLGPVGSTVAITGQNFEKLANVRFNGLNANYVFESGSNLTATVPLNATPGPISLLATEGDIATATNDFIITRESDLRVIQNYQPVIALVGEPIDIVIDLTNAGPAIVTAVTLTLTVPDNFLAIQSVAADLGQCTFTNGTVTCSIPAFTNGHAARVSVKVSAITAGSFTSSVSVTAREGDSRSADNSSSIPIPVVRDVDRFLSIEDIGADRVKLRWNFSAARFDLQATENLFKAGTPWLTITDGVFNVTQNFAIFHVYTNQVTQTRRFFRLIRE